MSRKAATATPATGATMATKIFLLEFCDLGLVLGLDFVFVDGDGVSVGVDEALFEGETKLDWSPTSDTTHRMSRWNCPADIFFKAD